jgi:hypothetical protein
VTSKIAVFKDEYRGPVINDCSGYFLKVAERLKIKVPPGRAENIISFLSQNWVRIGKGSQDGPTAQDFSRREYVVVALLGAKKHLQFKRNSKTNKFDIPYPRNSGHVAIVLPTQTTNYPYVIYGSGSTNGFGKSDGTLKVYEAGHGSPWRDVDAPNVEYYRTATPVPDPER